MEQVHGNNVVLVDKNDIGRVVPNCDGLIINSPNVHLQIRVADCLPIFIKDLQNNAIGVVHAGWRGLESKVIKNAVNLMQEKFTSRPENLTVYIGPHICKKHYEVKSDVGDKFGGELFLDLGKIAKEQFESLGVKNIEISKDCTFENKDLFSYRRDKTEKRNFYNFSLDI